MFKHPSGSKVSLSAAASRGPKPGPSSSTAARVNEAKRSLNFDQPEFRYYIQRKSYVLIFLSYSFFVPFSQRMEPYNTRSKKSLKDVPIEQLDLFVAPDFTADMYDTTDPEYADFLGETFSKPITAQPGSNRGDEESGTDQDPDYNFEGECEDQSSTHDEFKYDKSARIPKREVDDLLSEIITEYGLNEEDADPQVCFIFALIPLIHFWSPFQLGRVLKKRHQEEKEAELLESFYEDMGTNQEANLQVGSTRAGD